jgi:ribosomal protein L37E
MSLLQRLFGKEPPQRETRCSRCDTPAPEGSLECSACGWDLREIYHDPLQEPAETR